MIRYIVKRLLLLIPILLAVAVIIFGLMQMIPGDPVAASMEGATQAEIDAAREALGLNEPFIVQLGQYLKNLVFRLDLGVSYSYNIPVMSQILTRVPKTLLIAVLSMILIVIIGVPVGIYAAVNANSAKDHVSMFICLLGVSMPTFWLSFLLISLFCLKLNWLPSSGDSGLIYFILPVLATAINGVAGIARQTRASMLEVIRADYVVTARAKGQTERKVIYGHALPNALIPIITLMGNRFGRALGDAVVIETIFSITGLGTYLINGIYLRDYTVVQGSVLAIAFLFSIVMLIVDLVYAVVDPRIRSRYAKKK